MNYCTYLNLLLVRYCELAIEKGVRSWFFFLSCYHKSNSIYCLDNNLSKLLAYCKVIPNDEIKISMFHRYELRRRRSLQHSEGDGNTTSSSAATTDEVINFV